jgi:hypothetical protein
VVTAVAVTVVVTAFVVVVNVVTAVLVLLEAALLVLCRVEEAGTVAVVVLVLLIGAPVVVAGAVTKGGMSDAGASARFDAQSMATVLGGSGALAAEPAAMVSVARRLLKREPSEVCSSALPKMMRYAGTL